MKIHMAWNGSMQFESATPSGAKFVMDSDSEFGGETAGPTPVEALVSAMGACAAMDVISILKKKRQTVSAYRLEISWERGPEGEFPRPVTKVEIRHVLSGDGLDPAAVERAVQLSDEKYCSVVATVRTGAEVTSAWEVVG
ncbi:MAG: OsmC family protein [Armatimonadetes bacterium]|nr:OsmC family protein [Armatimonadota bacterium]